MEHYIKAIFAATVAVFIASAAGAQQPSGSGASKDGLLELPSVPVTSSAPASPAPVPNMPPAQPARQTPVASGLPTLPELPKAPIPTAPLSPSAPAIPPAITAPQAAMGSVVQIPQSADAQAESQANDQRSNLTLMFTPDDMNNVSHALKIYDTYDEHAPVPTETAAPIKPEIQDDIFAGYGAAAPPNVFLSSIVYYSPKNWSIRLNDKRVNATDNAPNNRFYISKISRREVELVWTLTSISDIANRWEQVTEDGKNPIPNVRVDSAGNKIILDMRPNQTFVINTLDIHEGLIK